MVAADQMVKDIFSWIDQREKCANKLKKLARELEELRENCNASRAVGSTVTAVGVLGLIGAGAATVFTGGAAAPLLGAAAVCAAAGATINLIIELIEHLKESATMNAAKKIDKEVCEITERIQRLFQQLKEECEKTGSDDQDRYAMTEIVGAIATRNGLNPRFIKHTFQQYFSSGVPGTIDVNMISLEPTLVGLAGVLTFFSLKASGVQSKTLFAKAAERMIKIVSEAGILGVFGKTILAVGRAIGKAFDLSEATDHWRNLIENNNVTGASKSLKDTADALRKLNRILRDQVDEIKQMLKKLDQLKRDIENSNRTSEEKKNFIRILQDICHDKEILKSLETTDDIEIFFKLVGIFHLLKQELDKKKKKTDREDIDIIFVAHGEIQEPLIPARDLLPLSTIEDVILYSPWNCTIDADVAYGIATGDLQTQHRIFCCGPDCGCSDADSHRPNTLPPNWNSMKKAGGSMIPKIFVSPLNHPEDPAWKRVLWLEDEFGEPGKNRVVIPYIIPEYDGGDSMTISFRVVTLALSVVLFIFPFTARVHLAACLSRPSETTLNEQSRDLERQYSWTTDKTHMTAKIKAPKRYLELYKALRAEFDR